MSLHINPINVYTSSIPNNNNSLMNLIGNGHMGTDLMNRIIMSLKSNIPSEAEWALGSLYQQSFISPDTIDFEKNEFLGRQLIEYFTKPFKFLQSGELDQITDKSINLSLDALLSLRNSIQDIRNQQWLSQVYEFKQELIDALKFLTNWFYKDGFTYRLEKYDNQFLECFYHLVDILDILTCYYINNPKTDELFNILLFVSLQTKDKYLIVGTLNCLTHLLFTKADTIFDNENTEYNDQKPVAGRGKEVLVPIYDNCIDNFEESHLEHYLNYLLVNDPKLNVSVLDFLKQYLSSGASNKNQSVEDSKFNRLQILLEIATNKHNLHTLFRQLPILLTPEFLLSHAASDYKVEEQLVRRTSGISVPLQTPLLTPDLYGIISKFKEPLRSSVWLRCCYEPIFNDTYDDNSSGELVIGEVTQISLWKAYEKQFEDIWKNKPSDYPDLLPAVDFIKNVTNAFPNSEAMVVMMNDVEPPKKKFIIRGIQPRQFPVDVDVANYEALKKKVVVDHNEIHPELPIGTVDQVKFKQSLDHLNSKILFSATNLKLNKINLLSKQILDYIFGEIERFENPQELIDVFRLYNKWLLDVVYANPVVIETELMSNDWLKYLM